jgi:CDP-glucose 4,6-dehydratase
MFNNVFEGKKVLVTGHTGFKGSWLCQWLLELGATVAGFSHETPKNPALFAALKLKKNIKHYEGDISDSNQINKIFNNFKPEIVIHMAAIATVTQSMVEPKRAFDVNVGGTVNILENLRLSDGAKAAIIVTTDRVSAENIQLFDPYTVSKQCVENITRSYFHTYLKQQDYPKIATVRAGNVIGGGDWSEGRLVPDCIRAFSQEQQPDIKDPTGVCRWQFVLEPLSGYLWLISKMITGDRRFVGKVINFAPAAKHKFSTAALVKSLKNAWQNKIEQLELPAAGEVEYQMLSGREDFGWEPFLNFDQTVNLTAAWYRNQFDSKNDIGEFTKQQIKFYTDLAQQKQVGWSLE